MAAALVSQANHLAFCDAQPVLEQPSVEKSPTAPTKATPVQGMRVDEEGDFHGIFPKRQLWQPKLEYPLWDTNWDGNELPATGDKEQDRNRMRHIRKTGVTRHIILIRHGQYDETHKVRYVGLLFIGSASLFHFASFLLILTT